MMRFFSLRRVGLLAALLFVGNASALYAQSVSALEVKLGHRLIMKPGGYVTFDPSPGSHNSSPQCMGFSEYRITELLGAAPESFAYAINDVGQVVGATDYSFLYSNGTITDLSPLAPNDINNAGQIAGSVPFGGVTVPAIFSSRTSELDLIGTLGGVTSYGFNGTANSINSAGDAAGYSYISGVNRHAFMYNHGNGIMTDLDPENTGYSVGSAINDSDTIAGFASSPQSNGVAQAFVYRGGLLTPIGPTTESYAQGINNLGQVVGDFLTDNQTAFHAFLYNKGAFIDLGSAGSTETVAFAINDQEQIVGITLVPYNTSCSGVPCIEYEQHAFIYENGGIVDLNSLIPPCSGWDLSWALDINNRGQIVGYGTINGSFHGFILTPGYE
jgi:probable HAF family extracellular repeat protein